MNRRPKPRGRNQKHNLNNLTPFLSVMGDRDNQTNALPSNLNEEELKNTVINRFETAGINIDKRNFHPIHRLADKRTVIARLTNRQDAIDTLR